MSFSVKTRIIDNVVVLDLSGRLTAGDAVMQLHKTLGSHLDSLDRKFVLNLKDVSYVDSSGLGELVWAYTSVRNKGGQVKLLNLTARVQDLLQITKLLTVFDTYDNESRAISSLTGWPPQYRRS